MSIKKSPISIIALKPGVFLYLCATLIFSGVFLGCEKSAPLPEIAVTEIAAPDNNGLSAGQSAPAPLLLKNVDPQDPEAVLQAIQNLLMADKETVLEWEAIFQKVEATEIGQLLMYGSQRADSGLSQMPLSESPVSRIARMEAEFAVPVSTPESQDADQKTQKEMLKTLAEENSLTVLEISSRRRKELPFLGSDMISISFSGSLQDSKRFVPHLENHPRMFLIQSLLIKPTEKRGPLLLIEGMLGVQSFYRIPAESPLN